MNFGVASFLHCPSTISCATGTLSKIYSREFEAVHPLHLFPNLNLYVRVRHSRSMVRCQSLSPWQPSPAVTYSTKEEDEEKHYLSKTTNIFENLTSKSESDPQTTDEVQTTSTNIRKAAEVLLFRMPMWLMGPSILLATGMVPTLWLPLSSVFLGPNIASLLSLVGLDCIFNLGAILFLLMADSSAQPCSAIQIRDSEAPPSYRFWNVIASSTGVLIPILVLFSSRKGILQPHLPFISAAILLGPYALLLFVQVLTEALTWHWRSPVWLVTPVVYEAYRVLQLMRGLKLGSEINAPVWMLNMIRGLVCWWVLVLGVQLMRVAWFAGTMVRQPSASADA